MVVTVLGLTSCTLTMRALDWAPDVVRRAANDEQNCAFSSARTVLALHDAGVGAEIRTMWVPYGGELPANNVSIVTDGDQKYMLHSYVVTQPIKGVRWVIDNGRLCPGNICALEHLR